MTFLHAFHDRSLAFINDLFKIYSSSSPSSSSSSSSSSLSLSLFSSFLFFKNVILSLIIELKLPPNDAYQKLRHTIDDFNTLLSTHAVGLDEDIYVSPLKGTVVFSSALFGISFTLGSFAKMYAANHGITYGRTRDGEVFCVCVCVCWEGR